MFFDELNCPFSDPYRVQADKFQSIELSAGMPMDRRFAEKLKLLKDILQGTVRSMNFHCGRGFLIKRPRLGSVCHSDD